MMNSTAALFLTVSLVLGGSAPVYAAKKSPKPQVISQAGNAQAPKGGTFYENIHEEPTTLNPITSSDGYTPKVLGYVLESMLDRNIDTFEWEPSLADKWEISSDGKIFTFHLRPDIKFEDGHPITSEDVKFSYDVIFDPTYNAAHWRPYFEGIEKVEAIDPQTVKVTTKTKYFNNFEIAAGMSILPKHIYGNAKEGVKLNKTVIGSGAYKLEKYDQGQRITLVRNPQWWGNAIPEYKGRNNFDRIVLRFVQDENTALEMTKKGELDYDELTPESYVKRAVGAEWGKTVEKVKAENKEPKKYAFIGWNERNILFKDRNVRLALQYLMNRELMNEKFRFGMALPATGPWYRQSEYADPSIKPTPFDPKKALAMLHAAGWDDTDKDGVLDKMIDGKKVNFEFNLMHGNKDSEKYFTLYQEDLKKVGIKMNIKLLEWNAFIKFLDDGNFDAVAMSWGAGGIDMDPKQVWHSSSAVKGGSNFIDYKNPEVDKLIDQSREEMDKKKRIIAYRKIYKLIADDSPYAWMFVDKYTLYAYTKKVAKPKDTFVYGVGTGFWWAVQP